MKASAGSVIAEAILHVAKKRAPNGSAADLWTVAANVANWSSKISDDSRGLILQTIYAELFPQDTAATAHGRG